MLRRLRAVSGTHVWRMSGSFSFSKSPRNSSSSSNNNDYAHNYQLSSRILKVYLHNEPKTYWTFAIEESLKVGTVLGQLAEKLSTTHLTLFSRTKSRLGRRIDKMLEPAASLYELSEKYKKKKKPYQLFVHVALGTSNDRLIRVRSADRMSMPLPRLPKTLLDDHDSELSDSLVSDRSSATTPRQLSTSHSAPLYLEGTEPGVAPVTTPMLVQQPPKEAEDVLFSNNNSLQKSFASQCVINAKGTFGYDLEPSSFFRQGSVYGYNTPPSNASVYQRLDLSKAVEDRDTISMKKQARRRITDISAASPPPTPMNSFKPRHAAPIDHAAFLKHRSADDMLSSTSSGEGDDSHDQFYSLPSKALQPALDTLIIIRMYASDNGDLDGPCWTLAVASRTKAREACLIVESQLGVEPKSLRVCIVDALSSSTTLKEERQIGDDEPLLKVRDEWLKRGRIPYFFLREQTTSLPIQDLPKRPLSSPDIRSKKHSESDDEKRELTAIFLGGSNVESFDSPAEYLEPVESPLGDSSDTIDSSTWTMEHNVQQEYSSRPHINWIPAHDLERVHKVGDGGYAKVYKSKYKDKFVAVKTLKGVATKEHMENFRKEFEVLSLTNSPYLIHFYGASIDETDPESPILSIVVEYCERGTMYKALNNKKLEVDWQTCFKWIHQTLHGILYLHNMTPQMVHRDIKTLNLLLDSKWNVKVADFGLSRAMSASNKTSLGILKGTLAYVAPEIHKGMLFTPKSDAYSVAIVLWELITRCMTGNYHAPYSEYSDIYFDYQIIFVTATQNRRPTIPPKTPQALKDLLQQCWVGNPDERPTCDEILLQIQSIYVQYRTEKKHWESLREIV